MTRSDNSNKYITKEDAARAYDKKARELYGKDAKTNFKDVKEIVTSYEHGKKNTTSKYKGVSITKSNTYQVHINRKYIGVFKTQEEAAKAYDKKAKELFGEKAKLNFYESL